MRSGLEIQLSVARGSRELFWRAGISAFCVSAFCVSAIAQSGGGYVITRSTVDGGGVTFHTDGLPDGYRLGGTVGQHDASGPLEDTGGTYRLIGGFWRGTPAPLLPGNDLCVGGGNAGQGCGQNSECPGGACRLKNRFVSATLPATATAHGVRVNLVSLDGNSVATPGSYDGTDRWVGVPMLGINDGISPSFNAARVQCAFASQDWSAVGLVHIYGDVVVPQSSYDVSMCSSAAGPCSAALRIGTAKFGDVVTPVNTVNFQDVNSIVAKFQGTPSGPSKTRTKLTNSIVNPANPINFQEVSACVSAFQSKAFKAVVTAAPVICP